MEIAPGVWRSNQPSPGRIRKLHKRGIRSILNLRGADDFSFHLFEKEACDQLGITLINHKCYARHLVYTPELMPLFDIFDRIEKPFLLHCKSGADRAGLVSALWLLDQEGASIAEAKAMLSWRFLHRKTTKTGLMDAILDTFEADTQAAPMPIRDWIATRYDAVAITADFHKKMGWPPPGSA